MKKLSIIFVNLIVFVIAASAIDVSNPFFDNLPVAVNKYLYVNFPDLKNVEWTTTIDGKYDVVFIAGKQEQEIVLNKEGDFIESKMEVANTDLPAFVVTRIKDIRNIKFAQKKIVANGDQQYVVELLRKNKLSEITFDSIGQVVAERPLSE